MDRSTPRLPEPDADARAHSARVEAALAGAIDEAGGFLPFERWMDLALNAPGLGYYAAGAQKFGAAGDFVTAAEISPLYARTLATDVAAILDATRGREIVELGAGSGAFAADVLAALDTAKVKLSRYAIVEPSAALKARQQARLSGDSRVTWLDAPPARIRGAVVMNEVLDALPVALVARRGGAWKLRGVVRHEGRFAFAERAPCAAGTAASGDDAALVAIAAARFPRGIDYLSEVNRAAEALVRLVAQSLEEGAMLIADYGFARHEYYHPQRAEGTLMAHYRHRATPDPFVWPGLADITAHVDFTAIAEAGEAEGLTVAGFATQAAYLVGAGVLDRLLEAGDPGSVEFLKASSAVQKLTSPAEMGELFKVIALERGVKVRWRGFAVGNRAHTL